MMKAAQQQVSTPGGNSNNGGSGGPGHGMLGSGQPHTPGALPGGNSPQPPAGILGGESRVVYSTSNCAEYKSSAGQRVGGYFVAGKRLVNDHLILYYYVKYYINHG